MLGDIGGFHDALIMIFESFMGYYAPVLFMQSLIKSLFKIDLFTPKSDKKKRQGHYNKVFTSKSADIQKKYNQTEDAIGKLVTKLARKPPSLFKRTVSLAETDLVNLIDLVTMRKSLKGSTLSAFLFQNFACLHNFFQPESLKNHLGFKKGAERVEQCFEVSNLVKL